MATIDDPKMIEKILRNNGFYADDSGEDPPCVLIASYMNDYGKEAYSLCYSDSAAKSLFNSPHCRQVVSLFEGGEVTDAGREWLRLRTSSTPWRCA